MNRISRFTLIASLAFAFTGAFLGHASASETSPSIKLPEYRSVKLDNGMTLLLMERHQLPLVSFRWIMRSGGSICDPPGKEGLAMLTAQLLRKGTQSRTADQISEAMDFVGGSLDAGGALEYSLGSGEFVKKDLDLAVDLLADLLLHPAFPPAEVDKMIKQEVDGILEDKAVPNHVIGRYFDRSLFGSHLYGRPTGGTEATLPKITREDIAGFYSAHYVPNQLILAVAGDISAADMEIRLRGKFGSWKSKEVTIPELKEPSRVQGTHALLVEKPDATQTFFRLGNLGLARTNPDWIPLQVVNTLFGGRFTSMINSELRIQSGLTYGANSSFTARQVPGAFAIASYTPNESTERALSMTLDVLKKIHEKGITPEQLQSAKAYMKGQFGPTLETNDQLANMICELEFFGLGAQYINTYFDKIDAMTLPDAKRVIEKYIPLKDFDFVLIGQAAIIDPVARKLTSDIQKKSITAPGF